MPFINKQDQEKTHLGEEDFEKAVKDIEEKTKKGEYDKYEPKGNKIEDLKELSRLRHKYFV